MMKYIFVCLSIVSLTATASAERRHYRHHHSPERTRVYDPERIIARDWPYVTVVFDYPLMTGTSVIDIAYVPFHLHPSPRDRIVACDPLTVEALTLSNIGH